MTSKELKDISEVSFNVPIHVNLGVRSTKKVFFNLNIVRNLQFHEQNNLKKLMKKIVLDACPKFSFKEYELEYYLYLPNKLKRDISNICSVVDKYACDALVELGYVKEDNYEYLKKVTFSLGGFDPEKEGYVTIKVIKIK